MDVSNCVSSCAFTSGLLLSRPAFCRSNGYQGVSLPVAKETVDLEKHVRQMILNDNLMFPHTDTME